MLLRGLQPSQPIFQEASEFFKLIVNKGLLLQITCSSSTPQPVQQHSVLDQLLLEDNKVFEVPTGLPPLRDCEHQIFLKEGTLPICERPYRYPYYQKIEI